MSVPVSLVVIAAIDAGTLIVKVDPTPGVLRT
jgi:hypothetical protein